jgi:hypothetical protein
MPEVRALTTLRRHATDTSVARRVDAGEIFEVSEEEAVQLVAEGYAEAIAAKPDPPELPRRKPK